ncbi:[FeFe] hydrogenase H-cluster radical SAM maturase HydE [Deltaproteobacteria bacterium OttesenSCG-928-K17]|nr:[FeFe] hydrogenase H-cluster radical SAM maturase HydE [Deltaproteobacteria bacterium OttesenSCG-928-K17]
MKKLIDRLAQEQRLSRADWLRLLPCYGDPALGAHLAELASAGRDRVFGRVVYLRGLIEFSNYCMNDCLYCGLRRGNHNVERYRLGRDEILASCEYGYELGFRTFVLQSGEEPNNDDLDLVETIEAIRARFPDCAITLSVGEKSRSTYERYFSAGADRFLLRHETADAVHYSKLHPPSMSLANRLRCLEDLAAIGFQVGAGFMVGSPWQSWETLAEDMLLLEKLAPQMVGIGPFIAHPQTPLAAYPSGGVQLTLFILGLVRLMLPKVLLPATTALGTVEEAARERALDFGANVLMPNLSPPAVRKKYEIYAGKIHLNQEAAEGLASLKKRLAELGYESPACRGDAPINLESME